MHGTKDYGNVSPKETTYRLDDMAELAVRLNALQSLDRLGDVIYKEDFSNGIYVWTKTLSGTGASIILDTTHFKGGGFAAKLVGGSNNSRSAKISMSFPYPVLSSFGLEYCLTLGTDIQYGEVRFEIRYSGYVYYGSVSLNPLLNNITYVDGDGAVQTLVSDAKLIINDYLYNNIKLVIDLINKKYKRFCYNSGVATMEGLVLPNFYVGGSDYIVITFTAYSSLGVNGVSYLDNVIVTQNEP